MKASITSLVGLALLTWASAARADLRAYWSFDDGAGTTLTDSSGNGVNGTLEGATLPAWVGGTTGNAGDSALSFTAAGQLGAPTAATLPGVGSSRVDLGVTSQATLTGNETISMWLRPNASAVRQNPFGISYSGAGAIVIETTAIPNIDGFNFFYGSGGDNCCAHNGGVDSAAITRDGATWTHVVFRRDGGADDLQPWTSSILFNGTDVTVAGADVNEVVTDSGTAPVFIGAGYVNSFDGLIDDTAIWNEVLTDGEVSALYNARGVAGNPFLENGFDVTDLDQIFQVHQDGGASEVTIDDFAFTYSPDVGTLFPALGLGEAVQNGNQIALLLDGSGTGVFGTLPPLAPEPGTFVLFAVIVTGLGTHVWRRRQRRISAA